MPSHQWLAPVRKQLAEFGGIAVVNVEKKPAPSPHRNPRAVSPVHALLTVRVDALYCNRHAAGVVDEADETIPNAVVLAGAMASDMAAVLLVPSVQSRNP